MAPFFLIKAAPGYTITLLHGALDGETQITKPLFFRGFSEKKTTVREGSFQGSGNNSEEE